jgi:hypothetical protein
LLPLVVLAVQAARGRPVPQAAERNLVYLHALVACTVCFAVAAVFAFALHFPGRYTQRVLGPLEWLALGQVLGQWQGGKRLGRAVMLGLLTVLMLTPLPGLVRPDAGLVRAVRQLPSDARIAGVSEELGALPPLTGRAITAATEQAIPWHMGYYGPFERNLRLSLTVVSTPNPEVLRAALLGSDADYLLIDRNLLERLRVPERYGQVLPSAAAAADRGLASGLAIVPHAAPACAVYQDRAVMLLSAECLIGSALSATAPDRL